MWFRTLASSAAGMPTPPRPRSREAIVAASAGSDESVEFLVEIRAR
jgi:hypothetical protein